MKQNKLAKALMKGSRLTQSDAARLVLEGIEQLGERTKGNTREGVMNLLRRVMQEGVRAVEAAEHTVTLREAIWASVEARKELRPTSCRDLRNYARRLLRVEGAGDMPLRAMRVADCKRLLAAAFGSSASSYKKGRAVLSSVFSYGMRQEWCDANPVSRIDVPRVEEKAIVPLTPKEVQRLKDIADTPQHRAMRFSLRLMLYGGIRPTEVSRLRPEDIYWEEGQVIIRPTASKTGGGRTVPLYGIQGLHQSESTIPRNWLRRWRALRRAAGFRHRSWVPDICRHTFATYHAAVHGDLPQLQMIMGHRDVSLLRTRYVAPALRKDASIFWDEANTRQSKKTAPFHTPNK